MSKETKNKNNLEKVPEINVGIIGHIDHGKTTLLSRLSGKFTDTHSEELKRGITIKLGYADMLIYKEGKTLTIKPEDKKKAEPIRYVSFIDAPGHEMLMATMLSGAATMDAAILVVAANEGIKPQTREHFMALQAKNIKNIIVVQNKIDLVDKKQAIKNHKEIKEFLKGSNAENAPIIPTSAQQGVNIDKILEEINKIEIPERDAKSKPIFLVARSFDINRPGNHLEKIKGGVLGGILKRGVLKVGDQIELKPGILVEKAHKKEYRTVNAKILSLHKGKNSVKEIGPGASISIETSLDPSLAKTDSLSGSLVSLKGELPEITYKLKLKTKLFEEVLGTSEHEKVQPIKTKEMLMISVNTTISVGSVEKVEEDEIEIALNIPIVPLKGDNVGIARNIDRHWRLIGWGEVLE